MTATAPSRFECERSALASVSNQSAISSKASPRRFGHAGIHVGVFVRFTRHRRLQVFAAGTDRQVRRRFAHLRQVVEMAVRMSRLAFGGRAE